MRISYTRIRWEYIIYGLHGTALSKDYIGKCVNDEDFVVI